MRRQTGLILVLLSVLVCACQSALQSQLETALDNPEQTGIRWGLVVADLDGNELAAIRPDERFMPASNTKIITTMASHHFLGVLDTAEFNPGTRVYLEPTSETGPPNLIIKGGGDAMLSDGPDCPHTCLEELADAVVATGIAQVAAVIGDDTLFPHERWGLGWSVEDLKYYFGTAVSALSVNDNLVWVDIEPGAAQGELARISWQEGDDCFDLENNVTTSSAEIVRTLRVERHPGSKTVRVYGTMPIDQSILSFGLAIDNPAELTALRFTRLLRARGIEVTETSTRHRPLALIDEAPETRDALAKFVGNRNRVPDQPIAKLAASPLTDSLTVISKDSQNLHAEIALRRLGLLDGTGSRDYGVAKLNDFLRLANISEQGMSIHGGSGMSVYNRISPRSMVRLLAFASKQPWYHAWRGEQPVGGIDGSLQRRFQGTPLEGKIFAKTGTLNGANALSGSLIAASGRELLFSILANDRPTGTRSAIAEMDAALLAIAAAY